jgi:putative ribosome biogenesis GTPase RsgA
MHEKEKIKALLFLEKTDTTDPGRQTQIATYRALETQVHYFVLGISDSNKISLENFYKKRHYFFTGILRIVNDFSHLCGFSQ